MRNRTLGVSASASASASASVGVGNQGKHVVVSELCAFIQHEHSEAIQRSGSPHGKATEATVARQVQAGKQSIATFAEQLGKCCVWQLLQPSEFERCEK